jgi:hypothetical protein
MGDNLKRSNAEMVSEVRVRGVSKKTNQDLINIAKRAGVKLNDFLKMKLTEIRDSYPEEKRTPPTSY